MPRILDNLSPGADTRMESSLLETLHTSRSLDVAVGYFNLRGWRLIAGAVTGLPGGPDRPKARVLVGMTEDPQAEMRRLMRTRQSPPPDADSAFEAFGEAIREFRAQLEVGLPTPTDEQALRMLRHQLRTGEVDLRLYLAHRLHAKLYLAHRDDIPVPRVGYVGSSNLTKAGLREQGELNVDVTDVTATAQLARWFEDLWNDPFTIEANPDLVKILDDSWAGEGLLDPYLVYLKMAYHLSQEAREGLIRFGLPASMSAKLLEFQSAAVKIAARLVMDRGGALIGDVVGLGKTLVATAIARLLQEDQGWETLIVCPKNLVPMWKEYRQEYKLHGEVLSLSMVARKLETMRRYRLVVVDESHNLRNPKRKDHQALTRYIRDNESRVLRLSATPYNKSLDDLNGQLSLFLDDRSDLGIRPQEAIAERGEDLFAIDCEGRTSSLAAFRRSTHLGDWQALMSQYMVRRTRRFIEDNYAETDRHGRKYLTFGRQRSDRFYFPDRVARPIEREPEEGDPARAMMSDSTLNAVKELRRPRYSFAAYLAGATPAGEQERILLEDLKRARGSVAGFNRVMMFKRLTSSGPAFVLTLRRHLLRDRVTLHAMETGQPIPIGDIDKAVWDLELGIENDGMFQADREDLAPAEAYRRLRNQPPKKLRWLDTRHLKPGFAPALRDDIRSIEGMLDRFSEWDQAADGKINVLAELIQNHHATEKVLVFTEYSDTAAYVGKALRRRGIEQPAVVTGQAGNATGLARRFSPGSHLRSVAGAGELRVLVSTDVLSEGQNLQDARIVVNYDLPWAIVKLVQRAGRVDRIGQKAEEVILYSLMPAASVEGEITLRKRIRDRLGEAAQLLGSDEQFFGDDREREIVTGMFDELSEWDLEAAEDVDPVSMAYEIWRTAERDHPEMAARVERLPNVVYATLPSASTGKEARPPGVVVHSQTVTGADTFALVKVGGHARRLTPQEALRNAKCAPDTPPSSPRSDHHDLVAAAFKGPLTTPPEKVAVAPTGVRGRCYNKLKDHAAQAQPDLFVEPDDLDLALEDMRKFPLLDTALQRLARALRELGTPDLAALIVDLHKEKMLCDYPDPSLPHREPRVICSMGFA